VCLQGDDIEGAPLLDDAADVVLSSPPSQVIIKDRVHTTKFPDSCDHHLKVYSPAPFKMHVCAVPARVSSALNAI